MKEIRYTRQRSEREYMFFGALPCTYFVNDELNYQKLENYIDELIDFAAEIREHEPTWKRGEE